jgi:hypothetical protein
VRHWRPRRAEDVELAGARLDLRAVTEAVHLRRAGRESLERHVHPTVGVASLVRPELDAPGRRHQCEVEIAVAVEVHGLRGDRARKIRVHAREIAAAAVPPERGPPGAREQQVERAVVVEVEEERDAARRDRLRRGERAVPAIPGDGRGAFRGEDEVRPPVPIQVPGRDPRHGAGGGEIGGPFRETASAPVVEQPKAAAGFREHEIRISVAVEVGHGRGERRRARRKSGRRHVREGVV